MNKLKIKYKRLADICPVCKKYVFKEPYDICEVCGWENDRVQRRDPNFKGGANKLSLNEAIKQYEESKKNS